MSPHVRVELKLTAEFDEDDVLLELSNRVDDDGERYLLAESPGTDFSIEIGEDEVSELRDYLTRYLNQVR